MIGEIGGTAEEEAAAYIKTHVQEAGGRASSRGRPRRRGVVWAMRARSSPAGKGTAAEKMAALTAAGVHVVKSPADIGAAVQEALRA